MKSKDKNMENIYEAFGELIKWPQCVIIGKKITIEQAKKILSKTDSMFVYGYDGNNREYNKEVYNIIRRPDIFGGNNFDNSMWDKERDFVVRNGLLELEYLYNSRISSCYIFGTNGWCHPNGTIFFNKNVGKWPNWESLHDDCKVLANAFPFLDMKVYLFNQEWSTKEDKGESYDYPRKCVGGFSIKDGKCELLNEQEYLSPNDDAVIDHYSFYTIEEKIKEKQEIFGDKADLNILHRTNELFFNIEEFKSYFKGCFI